MKGNCFREEDVHLFLEVYDGGGSFYDVYFELLECYMVGCKFLCGGESSLWEVGVKEAEVGGRCVEIGW